MKIAIIGGGIIGLATAYKLISKFPKLSITIFEKENTYGTHQSGKNSGVLHCGLYYKPGSLKAKLAISGIREMTAFCRAHEVNHEICGKIVVATNKREINTLKELANRGKANGLSDLKFLTKSQINKREPTVHSRNALLVPQEGIVDYKSVMSQLVRLLMERGCEIIFNSKVKILKTTSNSLNVINCNNIEYIFDRVIVCAGLHSDRTYGVLTGKQSPLKIIPFRGEYLKFKPEFQDIVKNLVYPVPDINYPFLGVHFTRLISGETEVGPNAVLAFKREGYNKTDFNLYDAIDSLTYIGLIKFVLKNFKFSFDELRSSLFLENFVNKAKKLIPDVSENMLIKGPAGVRAQAMDPKGNLLMDFNIMRVENQVHVLNAPSPGATCSFAIADYIIENYLSDV